MKFLINRPSLAIRLSIPFPRLFALLLCLALSQFSLHAQDPAAEGKETGTEVCPAEPCPCDDFFREMSVYYFGEDNVNIDVYRNASENQLITSFANVNSGDLLVIDGSMTINNRLGTYTYLRVTNAADEYCTTRIFSRCPSNAWPGALDDQKVIGKTFDDFVVYAHTDLDASECTIADTEQDWHVGGNVIGPAQNTMGTRNNEDVVFISHDAPRGTITRSGEWGINTLAPTAQLDVQGDAVIDETLDVNGIARMNAGTPSNSTATGALLVTGGAGISENLHIGNDANVGNNLDVAQNARIGTDLAVGRDAGIGRNLDVVQDGQIGNDLGVGHNLDVINDGTIGNDLAVSRDANVGRSLSVTQDGQIGNNLTVGNNLDVAQSGTIGGDLDVGRDISAGRNLSVTQSGQIGNDLAIGNDLDVNNDATIASNLSVGSNAVVGNNLAVGQSANISVDANIGNDLDVNGDAHVNGTVTIGTNSTPNMLGTVSTAAYQLFVDGGILTEEVLVRTGWADYVFEVGYELMSLEDVKAYIAKHGHLPNVPSAQEVENNGLGLGNAAMLQQEKIEELFLHLIELNEAVKTLQTENQALKAQLENFR